MNELIINYLHCWVRVQVLYIHTKGVSYQVRHPPIDDWTNMMIYFLVERHRRAFHLLSSGEFQAAGSNHVRTNGQEFFSGNMWWATATFLAQLAPLGWTEWKYGGENWLLSDKTISCRVYELHDSGTNHYRDRYLRSSYAME